MSSILKHRSALLAAILFVVVFDVAFLWQRLGSAYASEFGGHPDEAAHFVTGLMVRDYVAAGFPGSPMKYAEEYYRHYPKIGLGVWPPFFYVVQTIWMLPFGVSRTSVLLLIAAIASLTALLIFVALRREPRGRYAALGALLWVSLPLVREYYGMVMAEMLCAFLMFGATLSFGMFLDRERTRDVVIFGVLAGLAIMTKGTGLALAPMAAFALLFSRKWHLLLRPALWAGAAITAVLAGPWTWKFKDLGKGGWLQPSPSLGFTLEALPYYLGKFGLALGPVLAAFFLIGIYIVWRRSGETRGLWMASGALILAVVLFQSVMPVGLEARHLIPALPAAMLFIIAGFHASLRWLVQKSGNAGESLSAKANLAFGGLVLLTLASLLPVQTKGFSGFAAIAEQLLQTAAGEPVLVSSDARGEGMFIAEMALRDPKRPSYTIQRASKVLASSEWSGKGYRPKYSNGQQMYEALKQGDVRMIVLDDSVPEEKRVDHHDTLKQAIDLHSFAFWRMAESEMKRGGDIQLSSVRLYRIGRPGGEN